ncbi:cofactor-independent phosphoglycerate mutase [Candidatus Dependentiae bacterium]|nr:cofactor-independent phosphoglycerate mutase [Candidatus Dependentiae bacterium]
MKYVVILPDGMADNRYPELGNKSPVEYANTPGLDFISKNGIIGKVKTIPENLPSGSDVAIMSVMGYDPKLYFMSRGPLEAVSLDIKFNDHDIIFRCNNITVKDGKMYSSNANHIKTEESFELINYFNSKNKFEGIRLFPGTGYRHIILINNVKYPEIDYESLKCAPPHDIVNCDILKNLPEGKGSELIKEFMFFSSEILKDYKTKSGNEPNMLWLWGQGKIKKLEKFKEKYNVKGGVISAVDLINGLGKYVGFDVIKVPGATGYYDTNFKGKAEYAIKALGDYDFVFVHIEATDEAGHDGNLNKKIEMIEHVDKFIISEMLKALNDYEEYRVMVLPDHPTPVTLRTHENKPVPYAIFGNKNQVKSGNCFSEFFEYPSSNYFSEGHLLMEKFIRNIEYFK